MISTSAFIFFRIRLFGSNSSMLLHLFDDPDQLLGSLSKILFLSRLFSSTRIYSFLCSEYFHSI